MIYLILILLAVICLLDFIKNKKIYTPLFTFNFIWLITLALYELKLSKLQQDLSNRTILIFFICIVSYNLTCFIFSYFKIGKIIKEKFISKKKNKSTETNKNTERIENTEKRENIEKNESLKKNGIFEIIFTKIKVILSKDVNTKVRICKYIAIIIFIIEIIYSGGLPLIWKIIGDNKNYFDFGIPSLNGAWYGLIICLGAYSFFSKSKDKYLYLLIGILILSRQVIMSIIIEAIIFNMLDKTKKIDIKKYVILAVVVFIGFNILGNIRSGSDEMNKVFKAKDEYANLSTSIKWVYSYMTFSISNFNNLVSKTDGGVNYGITTLKNILPSVVLNVLNLEENFKTNYLVSLNFNVSTYLPPLYLDFGIIGIAIFNILIAILGIILYNKAQETNLVKHRLLYSVFVHNIVFLFFTNMFLYLPIVIQFLYIPIIFYENTKGNEPQETDKSLIKGEEKIEKES